MRAFRGQLIAGVALLVAFSCDPAGSKPSLSSTEAWKIAQEKWRVRDVRAHQAWTSLSPESAEGRLAATLLARADAYYLKGIRLLESGESAEGQRALVKGADIAPINPAHYFRLAAMYDDRELDELALKYYQKCIDALPDAPLADEARRRVQALDSLFDPPKPPPAEEGRLSRELTAAAGGLLALAFLFVWWSKRGRGVSLSRLIERNPELHSAIAYLIGSLRHELLKHRIGAVSDVISGWGAGDIAAAQRAFLHNRLYGGVPVLEAWNAHLTAFRGALGHRLNLERDRAFRRAGKAIRTIQRMQSALSEPDLRAERRLVRAHRILKTFDYYLAGLQSRLVRTCVDDGLFRQVTDEVGGEYTVSGIRLDGLEVSPLAAPVYIEVPRGDLVLILKNILRNAILAVAQQERDRFVRMYAEVSLEITGEESVHIGVADSSEASLDGDALTGTGISSGLGLVATAVKRYGGTVSVRPAKRPVNKAVDIRFFRVFENGQNGRG